MKLKEFYVQTLKEQQINILFRELRCVEEVEFLKNLNDAIDLRIADIKCHIITNMYAKEVMDNKIIELKNIQTLIKRRLDLEIFS